ncbi:hypothetical protein PoB_000234400 [Plakobranchus ocellatus]|uniref:Uncharacterized protein n=1 Tax=Plakobranchus ocellatus TaxID=259542 RepID=A0AAV3XYA9_9GAST|nr:hypothetical protein PoB_000234400 [Plakobranchus ocellatus]
MEPLSQPITEHSTVQEVLKISQEAGKAADQKFTCITFDLAVAKMAYSLVWQDKILYNDVIIHLGVFHILCAYLKAIGKMMCGSGFEEVVIECKTCATGSIEKVIRDKHYNRLLRVHKTVLEALERPLFSALQQRLQVGSLVEMAKEELKDVSNSNNTNCDERRSSLKELLNVIFSSNRMFVTVS